MFSATKFVITAVIVALSGGFLVTSVLTQQVDAAPHPVGASASPDDAGIHWQTEVVDLRAERMTLELDGSTFTTEGAEVVVDGDTGHERGWSLRVRWVEDGRPQELYLHFRSNETDWWVNYVKWGVLNERFQSNVQQKRTPAILMPSQSVDCEGAGNILTCDPLDIVAVKGVLTFDGLRLSVAPREPAVIDKALDFLRLDGLVDSLFGRAVEPTKHYPMECLTQCPDGVCRIPDDRVPQASPDGTLRVTDG